MLTRHSLSTIYNNAVIFKLQCKLQFKLQLFAQFATTTIKLQLAVVQL